MDRFTDGPVFRWTGFQMDRFSDGPVFRWTVFQIDRFLDDRIQLDAKYNIRFACPSPHQIAAARPSSPIAFAAGILVANRRDFRGAERYGRNSEYKEENAA